MKKMKLISTLLLTGLFLVSCGGDKKDNAASETKTEAVKTENLDPMLDKGVGPITSIALGEIDQKMADEGKAVFLEKCSACHKISKRVVGPALVGVTTRRSPEWIMNMILNPEKMVKENPIAKKLLAEYVAPMANQNLTEAEARLILEYFRTKTSAEGE